MRHFLRVSFIIVSALIAFGLDQSGVLSSLNNVLEHQRLTWSNRAPTGEIVLVEIDSESLREFDVWPWPRDIYADLLDVLMDVGADEVAFDIDFSSRSTEEADAAFEAALERAGGYAFVASFEQFSGITRQIERSVPLERFSRHADPVLVNVVLDRWGLVRSVPLHAISGDPPTPAIALMLGRPRVDFPSPALVDFSIDLNQIDRLSVSEVLNESFDPRRIEGKRVVVGASAIELRDFFSTPRFGIIPGPLVQIAAAETIASGRVLQAVDHIVLLAILAVIGLMMILAIQLSGITAAAIAAVLLALLVEVGAWLLFRGQALIFDTAMIHTGISFMLILAAGEQAYLWFTQRRTMQLRLQYLARHDEVTGALSRYGFVEKLQADIEAERPMLVMVVQVLRLGAVRGALGHEIADATLKEISERLNSIVPDYVARVGDERFAVAYRSRDTALMVKKLSEQARFSLSEPFSVDERLVHVDIEMAGASVAEVGESAADVLTFAELSLDGRKGSSDGHATLFTPELANELSRRRQLDLDMRTALRTGGFRLAMQPQVKLASRKLVGVEALIRWEHPELGYIPPPELIGLAEETGFIVDLGRWALNEAVRISAGWNWRGRVAVNVSPLQIEFGDMLSEIRHVLTANEMHPSRLEIEVTETVAAEEGSRVSKLLQDVRKLGVTVAIDDFGTGYSSLSYINQLPFDLLKIDRSFVTAVHADPERLAILETIVDMGKRLKKTILVEGIETRAEHELVLGLGCDIGQGYFYGKPVDAKQLANHLSKKRA